MICPLENSKQTKFFDKGKTKTVAANIIKTCKHFTQPPLGECLSQIIDQFTTEYSTRLPIMGRRVVERQGKNIIKTNVVYPVNWTFEIVL